MQKEDDQAEKLLFKQFKQYCDVLQSLKLCLDDVLLHPFVLSCADLIPDSDDNNSLVMFGFLSPSLY